MVDFGGLVLRPNMTAMGMTITKMAMKRSVQRMYIGTPKNFDLQYFLVFPPLGRCVCSNRSSDDGIVESGVETVGS